MNFEFGEIYLVCLNKTLALPTHLPKESYISQAISSSSAPPRNTCHNRKSVLYTVIIPQTRCACTWGVCACVGGGGEVVGSRKEQGEARPPIPNLVSLLRGPRVRNRIHIQTLLSLLMQLAVLFFNKAFE